ncbi:MAG: nucleoside-triphosphatase [Bacteroidota bacterium]
MNGVKKLDDKWIKASVLGTIWAASEIVLGSFLHNLRVPFSGNILTAIALVILISATYKWKDKGLFWRAGLICALLKTMSPSAVIFGPMVAILSEAILLEVSTRLLGRTIPGFILGSILAMSWNLVQKVFNFIIFYGFNIVEVYTNLMQYAERQLGLNFDAVWAPLFVLLLIYALFGTTSALIGIRTGRKMTNNPIQFQPENRQNDSSFPGRTRINNFNYSFIWLTANIIFMAGALIMIGRIHFGIWVALVAAIAITWALRYKRALRQLVRPKLWIFFVVITMVTAFVLTRLQSDSISTFDAVLIGVEMNLRAIILIMGFTVLGTELYNPVIRNSLSKSYFRQLPIALELSLESLPTMIAQTPDLKTISKKPALFIQQIMAFADFRINEIKNRQASTPNVLIITGDIGSGKTTCIKNLAEKLQKQNITVSGFYSSRVMRKNKAIGYDIVDISTRQTKKLLRTSGNGSQNKIGRYFIYPEGLKAGEMALQRDSSQIVIVDEVGKLELEGNGWSTHLKHVVKNHKGYFLLSVRKEVIKEVIKHFNLSPKKIIDIEKDNCSDLEELINHQFNLSP